MTQQGFFQHNMKENVKKKKKKKEVALQSCLIDYINCITQQP